MRIAVTGGAGFLGSHLCHFLLERGDRVLCIDNFFTGNEENVKTLLSNPNFVPYQCDTRDYARLSQIFKQEKVELVYHYAAVVGVKRTLERPLEVLDVNIKGTQNVLEAALKCGCKKVVNMSSSEVYGNPVAVPEREDGPKNVEMPYALSKLVGEEYARIYYQKYGLTTVSLRLFNVYGPRQDASPYGFVVAIFIDRVLKGKPPVIFGDGFQTRDFTYVQDCIEATVLAGDSDSVDGEVFNVAAGKPVTILDLAELIIELCGSKLVPVFEEPRPSEIRHRFADISKIRIALGYKPRCELRTGLGFTIEYYRKRG